MHTWLLGRFPAAGRDHLFADGHVPGAGASVYFESHPLQRLQRDVETLKGHVVFDWDRAAELAGRVLLGQPLQPTDMA